jgi:hypothetical protein
MLRILENAGEHPAGFRAVLDSGLCSGSDAAVFLRRGQKSERWGVDIKVQLRSNRVRESRGEWIIRPCCYYKNPP